MPEQEETGAIELPTDVRERIERRLPRTEFESAEEYVVFVLEEVLYEVEQDSDGEEFEAADEEEVKSRLKSLGYLNE